MITYIMRIGIIQSIVAAFTFFLCFATANSAETINYYYDQTHRLKKVEYSNANTSNSSYDSLGNRLIKTISASDENIPPTPPTSPSIENNALDILTEPILSWAATVDPDSGDQVIYSLLFGQPGNLALVYTGYEPSYIVPPLDSLTKYCWQVIARDGSNAETPSDVWCFTTGNSTPTASFTTETIAPNVVMFKDTSSSPDDRITAWQWDFDGDGQPDSTEQNPSYIFSEGGYQTVSLTVTDSHGTSHIVSQSFLCDYDGDSIHDSADNCSRDYNPLQEDQDQDGYGDACSTYHCVTNGFELQETLLNASYNKQHDVVMLAEGSYLVSAIHKDNPDDPRVPFTYSSKEPYSIFLLGGHSPDCSSRLVNPDTTILDGENIATNGLGVLSILVGGYQLDTDVIIDGITIQNGVSQVNTYSGGLDITVYEGGDISVSNSRILNNESLNLGGLAITFARGSLSLNRVSINSNQATAEDIGTGGAEIRTIDGKITIDSSSFQGNSGTTQGGLFVEAVGEYSRVDIENNLITYNSGGFGGGMAIHTESAFVSLTNNTITENSSSHEGGGVRITVAGDGEVELTNNIIWNNIAPFNPDISTYIPGTGGVESYHNIFNPVAVGHGFISETGTIDQDPLFADLFNGDFTLNISSPALDSGTSPSRGLPLLDFYGNSRVLDGDSDGTPAPDRGAFEFLPVNDQDGDGLSDAIEASLGTSPTDADSDDDGLLDSQEDANGNGVVDPGETDPTKADSDGDGIQDGTELGVTITDINHHTETSIFIPDHDPSGTTNPLLDDTDGDGVRDGDEDTNGNGRLDIGEQDPASENRQIFDDFSYPVINADKWRQQESVRESREGRLRLGIGGDVDEYGNLSQVIFLTGSEAVHTIEAEITLDSFKIQKAASWESVDAQLFATFYDDDNDDNNGGVSATIGLSGDSRGNVIANYGVSHSGGWFGDVLAPDLEPGEIYNAKMAYNEVDDTITFNLNNKEITVFVPSQVRPTQPDNSQLSTSITTDPGAPLSGYIKAGFDNVFLNGELAPYDTFSQTPLDITKWEGTYTEEMREIRAGKLWLGTQGQSGVRVIDHRMDSDHVTNYFEAVMMIPSESEVQGGAVGQARLRGIFYNESRGPGSGLEYDGITGEVMVLARIIQTGDNQLSFNALGLRFDAPDGSLYTVLFDHTFSTEIEFDRPVLASITYEDNSRLVVRCDNEFFDYVLPSTVYPSSNNDRRFQIRLDTSSGDYGFMRAIYDDVYTIDQKIAGDLDLDGNIDLKDVVLSLQTLTGTTPTPHIPRVQRSDVNENVKIDLSESIYIMREVSGD